MQRTLLLVLVAVGVVIGLPSAIAHAQGDIRGVSFRPTDAMPPGTGSGSADISAAPDGTYRVSVDFSSQSETLVLDDFDGATAFVVWGVDMQGVEHRIGALTSDLVLEDASIDFLASGLIMSAEADADAASRTGDILFAITLRKVDKAAAASTTGTATAAAPAPTPPPTAATSDSKPKELPTTGQLVRDLMVLAAVGLTLLVAGLQLKRARPAA
jgi:hypothetical protein